ncbi:MAG: DUF4864 domain-containing protein [Rhodothermales bacterium]
MRRLLPVLAFALLAVPAAAQPVPSPDLTPEEVVRLQVEALQHNDEPRPDAGIETAFRFASPSNRRATGPLARFAAMVKGPVYGDMLGFESAEYGEMRVEGDLAAQRVTLVQSDGRRVRFVFGLSKQTAGRCAGCWMTDTVVPEPMPTDRENGVRRI